MKVLILNGPPGCGKDTIANLLCEVAPVIQGEFKGILYKETAKLLRKIGESFGGPRGYPQASDVKARNEDRALKEEPWVGGLSVRRWLQITSEMVIKKDHGLDFFGREAAALWYGKYVSHIISDGGFREEVDAVVAKFGADNVHVIRLHRPGFNGFGTDTRRYIIGSRAIESDLDLEPGNPMPAVQYLQELLVDK